MQNRTAKFVSAIFASLLAGMPLTTVSLGAAPAADDCLSKPKGLAPEGSHWYYRVDRANQRQCWYLGAERAKARPQQQQSALTSPPPAVCSHAWRAYSVRTERMICRRRVAFLLPSAFSRSLASSQSPYSA